MTKIAFVVGVPRSGTTLLRVMLDSHSQIAAPPETPWITGAYGETSIVGLINALEQSSTGPVHNLLGVYPETLQRGARAMIETILADYTTACQKHRVVLKTPDDIRFIQVLNRIFPDAIFLHIVRDGRDVACSTLTKRANWGGVLNGNYRDFTIETAAQRWADWEIEGEKQLVQLEKGRVMRIRYEDLVNNPYQQLKRVVAFLGVPFEEQMLRYWELPHEFPVWEAGSRDVNSLCGIYRSSVGRWRRDLKTLEATLIWERHGPILEERGYSRE